MRSLRHKQAMSILMLDLDHFKRFNHNYGHNPGDYVLKTMVHHYSIPCVVKILFVVWVVRS